MQDAKQPGSKPGWLKIVPIGRQPKLTLLRIAVLVVGCVIIFKFVLLPIQVSGISMKPTYHDRHVNCVDRLAYRWHQAQRGDVVAIRFSRRAPTPTRVKCS